MRGSYERGGTHVPTLYDSGYKQPSYFHCDMCFKKEVLALQLTDGSAAVEASHVEKS